MIGPVALLKGAVTLVVADKAEDEDPAAGADKAAVAVKVAGEDLEVAQAVAKVVAVRAADVVLAENAGPDGHDVKKKIQVSSNAL